MAAHLNCRNVQSWAGGLFSDLLVYGDTQGNVRRACAAGAVETLLSVMRTFAADAHVLSLRVRRWVTFHKLRKAATKPSMLALSRPSSRRSNRV
jgi:hypothetical protein